MRRWRSLRLVYSKCGRDIFYKLIRRHPKKRSEEMFKEMRRVMSIAYTPVPKRPSRIRKRVRTQILRQPQKLVTRCRYETYPEDVFSERNKRFRRRLFSVYRGSTKPIRRVSHRSRIYPRSNPLRRRLALHHRPVRAAGSRYSVSGLRRVVRRGAIARTMTRMP